MRFEDVRRVALSLPEAVETPHFERTSFRVRGKIFATATPDGSSLNVFVDETEVRAAVAEDPVSFHELRWGKRVVGLSIDLGSASQGAVVELVTESWRRRAPRSLISRFEEGRGSVDLEDGPS